MTPTPTAETCIDLLVTFMAADRSLDPGPTESLPARLVALHPSIPDGNRPTWGTPLHFSFGSEHTVAGDRVRFFEGARGAEERFAYLIDQPDHEVRHSRRDGGWVTEDPQPILNRLFREIYLWALQVAPTQFEIVWQQPPVRRQNRRDRVREQARALIDEHCGIPLVEVHGEHWLLFMGPGVFLYPMSSALVVAAVDEAALQATGLHELEQHAEFTVRRREVHDSDDNLADNATVRLWLEELPATLPLSELWKVPWERLGHAYGGAGDVPAMLRPLERANNSEDLDGLSPLYSAVLHQGSRYTSTPFVIPFLGGLLATRPDLRRPLVEYLANATVPYEDAGFPEMEPMEPFTSWNTGTIVAAGRLWDQIAELTLDDDPATARSALRILSGLPQRSQDSFELLTSRPIRAEFAPASMLILGVLGRHAAADARALPRIGDDAAGDLRFAHAVARCLLEDRSSLAELLGHLGAEYESLWPWFEGSGLHLCTSALRALQDWPRGAELDQALAAATSVSPFARALVLSAAAPTIFPGGLPPNVAQANELQRSFLDLVRDGLEDPVGQGLKATAGTALGLTRAAAVRYLDGDFDPTL